MKQYEDNHFDIAVVDPNYGINAPNMTMGSNPNRTGRDKRGEIQYGNVSVAQRLKKGRLNSGAVKLKNRILNTSNINWDDKIPSSQYFNQLFRISKHQIIFGGNYFPLPPTRCLILWDKIQPLENFSQFELAWTSFDKPTKLYRLSNRSGNHELKKIHPTEKPRELYRKIFKDFTQKGWKVLDTHLGSGNSRIEAHKQEIDFTGFENDKIHFKDSVLSFELYLTNLKNSPTLFDLLTENKPQAS
jgi:site-specific DNA-methyltransferase (adenine-specific)